MKTTKEGLQVTILAVFKGQSKNYLNDNRTEYADLLRVQFSCGKISLICSTEILK